MSLQDDRSTKISSLLRNAEQEFQRGAIVEGTRLLQEATQLDANNANVQAAWHRLHNSSVSSDEGLIELLERCLEDASNKGNEQSWIELVQKGLISGKAAAQCLDLLLKSPHTEFSVHLLKILVSSQLEARKALAFSLSQDDGQVLGKLLSTDDGLSTATLVLLNDALWSSKDALAKCQKRTCEITTTILSKVDDSRTEQALVLLARLLTHPSSKAEYADTRSMASVLKYLDIRLSQTTRVQALLIVAKLLEYTAESGEESYIQFIIDRVASQTKNELINALSAAAAIFPIVPATSAKLFLVDGFVPRLVQNLEQRSLADTEDKNDFVQDAALDLFSAASVDKACREAVSQHCKSWLERISQRNSGTAAAKATLVLSKLGSASDVELTNRFSNMMLNDVQDQALALEGLAYTTLQPQAKENVVKNGQILKDIIAAAKKENKLSSLTILNNLTAYRPARSEEQKKMAQLKAYANSAKPLMDNPLDNDGMVTIRCKKTVEAGVVAVLTHCAKNTTSQTSLQMMSKILLSLSKEQTHRARMAKEGAVGTLLLINQRLSKIGSKDKSAIITASHALARILISTNPSHVFSSATPVTSAVSAMIPLLTPDPEQEERNLLPVFEALLALTNLASMEESSARDLIIRQSWDILEDQLLLSNNTLVQRASVELVCNLMLSPTGVSKFADGGSKAKTRMHILLALADVEDLATRKAAGGALAMLTEWDTAVSAVLSIERGCKILLAMCQDDIDDVRHRGMVCILNAISIPGDIGSQATSKIKAENGVELIRAAILTTKDANVLTMGAEILKQVT